MGRPRKRRREEGSTSNEQQSDHSTEPLTVTPATTNSSDAGLVQQPDFSDFFAGIEGLPAGNDAVDNFLRSTHNHYYPVTDAFMLSNDTQQSRYVSKLPQS
jgi:hypothetical protein